jgi:hypothetical protein
MSDLSAEVAARYDTDPGFRKAVDSLPFRLPKCIPVPASCLALAECVREALPDRLEDDFLFHISYYKDGLEISAIRLSEKDLELVPAVCVTVTDKSIEVYSTTIAGRWRHERDEKFFDDFADPSLFVKVAPSTSRRLVKLPEYQ